MFSLCIMWHTSITEESLRTAVFDPAAQREACSLQPHLLVQPLLLHCHKGNRGRVSRVACGWETTAGCPARRQGCCWGGAHMSPLPGGHYFLCYARVDNGFCPPWLPRRKVVQLNQRICRRWHLKLVSQRQFRVTKVISKVVVFTKAADHFLPGWVCIFLLDD